MILDNQSASLSKQETNQSHVSLWRRAYARNVRLYYPYRKYTNLFIFRFQSHASITQKATKHVKVYNRSFAITSRDPTPSWLISKTEMASALRPFEFSAYYKKLDGGPEKERYTKKFRSMCGFDPYETREYTKHTNQINQDGARWLDVASWASDLYCPNYWREMLS